MAKITGLPVSSALTGAEHLPIVQGGETKRTTMAAFRDLITPLLQNWYKGDKGETGASNNTRTSLDKLKAAPITDGTSLYDHAIWTWDADAVANGVDRVASNNSVTGAWIRQNGYDIAYLDSTVGFALNGIRASRSVSVLDFIPRQKWPSIRAGTNVDDLTAYFQEAARVCRTSLANADQEGIVVVPNGRYYVTHVGIRGVIFVGESTGGAEVRSFSSGDPGQFLFDAMLDVDGVTKNTVGGGWVEKMTLDGRLPDGTLSKRSGLRTYGGAQTVERLRIRHCDVGMAVGLPIWATIKNIQAAYCNVGFYTFHDSANDNGTSTTFMNCWAVHCTTYGFHLSQLYYSSLINCVGQESGVHNFYLQGDLNGNPACYSIQFIGCATEGAGTPFYLRRGRDISIVNPRIIAPSASTDLIVFDDVTGSISDFSTPGPPGAGKYHLRTTNVMPFSILLNNVDATYPPAQAGVYARASSGGPGGGIGEFAGSAYYVGVDRVLSSRGFAISDAVATNNASPAKAEFNSLVDTVNAILSRMRPGTGHGLIGE